MLGMLRLGHATAEQCIRDGLMQHSCFAWIGKFLFCNVTTAINTVTSCLLIHQLRPLLPAWACSGLRRLGPA